MNPIPIFVAVGSAVFIIILGVAIGVFSQRNRGGLALLSGLAMAAIAVSVANLYYDTSQKVLLFTLSAATNSGVYIVLKKVPDGNAAFLFLYDTKANIPREAYLREYPPKGFVETVIPDGRIVLAVSGKQIVVGDRDKAEFVPPVKN